MVTQYAIIFAYLFVNQNITTLTGFIHYHNSLIRYLNAANLVGNFCIAVLEAGVDIPDNISKIMDLHEFALSVDSTLLFTTVVHDGFTEDPFSTLRLGFIKHLNETIISLRSANYTGLDLNITNLILSDLDRLDNFYNKP